MVRHVVRNSHRMLRHLLKGYLRQPHGGRKPRGFLCLSPLCLHSEHVKKAVQTISGVNRCRFCSG